MGKKRNIGISLMAVMAMMLAMPNVIHAAPPTSTGTEANPAPNSTYTLVLVSIPVTSFGMTHRRIVTIKVMITIPFQ